MSWLEITVTTAPGGIEDVVSALSASGFEDLLIEDQQELEGFLDQNRAYWDYIDEKLQKQLQGLSRIKLYLEDTDTAGLSRLQSLLEKLKEKENRGTSVACKVMLGASIAFATLSTIAYTIISGI
jgi:ribosomal protein L11 methylase PrmA